MIEKMALIQITKRCNYSCVFCTEPPGKDMLAIEDIIGRIDSLAGADMLVITGGEPLTHPDFIAVIRHATQKFNSIIIQTNASLITRSIVDSLFPFRDQITFNISFHAQERDKYMKITGHDGLDLALSGIAVVGSAGFRYYITTVINTVNVDSLADHLSFMVREFKGMSHVVLNYVNPCFVREGDGWIVPKLSYAEKSLHDACSMMRDQRIEFAIDYVPFCCIPGFEDNGVVMSVGFGKDIMHGDKDKRDSLSWTDSCEQEFVRAPVCLSCSLRSRCRGITPGYARIHGTHEFYPVFEVKG